MDDAAVNTDTKLRWAEDRTDWAEDRTVLASERTFASWMRTGLASIAVALGLQAVFGDVDPTWAAKAVASAFILAAVAIFVAARHGAARSAKRMTFHTVKPQASRWMTLHMVMLSAGALGTGAILWTL